ncbi:MAG: glutamate synthase-related protein, partial [Turicibacter sp.]
LISVKLASLFNVGTIANGVVKAGAAKVVISGFNGGTGASPKSSLKYTGLPWEYGLYQTHVNLLQNDVRTKTLIQVDGQIKSGYDVIAAAILGADEFGIGTMALIGVDCIGCKMCHTNKCPKGITTQDTTLRQKLNTDTTPLKTYLTYLARQTRELMAAMGVKSLQELRGRTDLISIPDNNPYHLTLNWLEAHPCTESVTLQTPDYSSDILQPDMLNVVKSTQRTLGVGLVSDEVQTFKTYGYAGQSYGAFMNQTVNLIHEGYANDYVGKGLSGGLVVVKVDETIRELSLQNPEMINEHFIAGNTILYGATQGSCYIEGRVGERFAVRNSGVTAVNHGMGVHACEYMTGGVVVSLGGVEGNIGAGMTGGLLFVYKPSNLAQKLNTSYVGIYEMTDAHVSVLKQTLQDYVAKTGNVLASNILANFEAEVTHFNLVTSADYYQLSL